LPPPLCRPLARAAAMRSAFRCHGHSHALMNGPDEANCDLALMQPYIDECKTAVIEEVADGRRHDAPVEGLWLHAGGRCVSVPPCGAST